MFNAVYHWLNQLGYPHPIHPTEVHMPIGLIVGALIFRVAAILFRRPALIQTAHYCTILALLFLVPTVLLGFMDWQHFYAGAWLYAIKVKLTLAFVLVAWILVGLIYAHKRGPESGYILMNYGISFILVVVLGYYGGNLVYGDQRHMAPTPYMAGMKIFDANCASCHPKGGNIVDPSMPVVNSTYTKDTMALRNFIRNPRLPNGSPGAMPVFSSDTISDQDAEELYNYIVHVLESR